MTIPRLVESICKINARIDGSHLTKTPFVAVGIKKYLWKMGVYRIQRL